MNLDGFIMMGWKFPDAETSGVAYREASQRIMSREIDHVDGGCGLYRTAEPDHSAYYVVLIDQTDDGAGVAICESVRALMDAEPYVPDTGVARLLIARRMRQMLEAPNDGSGGMIRVEQHHNEGRGHFLHSDGTTHPFPEPRGQG